jgi:hypothetical protein
MAKKNFKASVSMDDYIQTLQQGLASYDEAMEYLAEFAVDDPEMGLFENHEMVLNAIKNCLGAWRATKN